MGSPDDALVSLGSGLAAVPAAGDFCSTDAGVLGHETQLDGTGAFQKSFGAGA